jgi:hypothetical protein
MVPQGTPAGAESSSPLAAGVHPPASGAGGTQPHQPLSCARTRLDQVPEGAARRASG